MDNVINKIDWKNILCEKRYPLWVLLVITASYTISFIIALRFITGTWL